MKEDVTIKDFFIHHETEDERRFGEAADRDKSMDDKLDKMLNNHLAHIEPDLAEAKIDLKWMKWIGYVIIAIEIAKLFGVQL